jgi:phosphoserine aminotransferase
MWLKALGGLEFMEERNGSKSGRLYSTIDTSNFYRCPVRPADRSRMNVAFTLADAELDGRFLEQAEAGGLLNLKGHRSVGGMRASLYNAVPEQAVDALIDFMQHFEADYA